MSSRKLVLISSDGMLFEVDEAVAVQSTFIKHIAEDITRSNEIKCHNVSGSILNKVVEYMKKHGNVEDGHNLSFWDSSFIQVKEDTLFDLMTAAEYLNIPKLLDLTLDAVAAMMGKKDTKELRKLFNITSDSTAEEEAKVRQENQWAFE